MKHQRHILEIPPTSGLPSLKMVGNRYIGPGTSGKKDTGLTLLMMHGLGQHKELWEPVLARLWASDGVKDSIREAWAFDWPSHGDSAVENDWFIGRSALAVPPSVWGIGIAKFFTEYMNGRRHVVVIGFSVGNIAFLNALGSLREPPVAGMIVIEPVLYSKEIVESNPESFEIADIMMSAIHSRALSWPNKNTARRYLRKRLPWSAWDDTVFQLYMEHGLKETKDDAGNVSSVTTKCSKYHEASTYAGYFDTFDASKKLEDLVKVRPVHVIFGEDEKMMPRAFSESVVEILKQGPVTSVTRVPGAFHTVAQEKPAEIADILSSLLKKTLLDNGARRSKL